MNVKDVIDKFIKENLIKNEDSTYSSKGSVKIPGYLVQDGQLLIQFKRVEENFIISNVGLETLKG